MIDMKEQDYYLHGRVFYPFLHTLAMSEWLLWCSVNGKPEPIRNSKPQEDRDETSELIRLVQFHSLVIIYNYNCIYKCIYIDIYTFRMLLKVIYRNLRIIGTFRDA